MICFEFILLKRIQWAMRSKTFPSSYKVITRAIYKCKKLETGIPTTNAVPYTSPSSQPEDAHSFPYPYKAPA